VKTEVIIGGCEITGVVLGLEYIFFKPKIEGLPLDEAFDPLLLGLFMINC
jgi:hypothetical protein